MRAIRHMRNDSINAVKRISTACVGEQPCCRHCNSKYDDNCNSVVNHSNRRYGCLVPISGSLYLPLNVSRNRLLCRPSYDKEEVDVSEGEATDKATRQTMPHYSLGELHDNGRGLGSSWRETRDVVRLLHLMGGGETCLAEPRESHDISLLFTAAVSTVFRSHRSYIHFHISLAEYPQHRYLIYFSLYRGTIYCLMIVSPLYPSTSASFPASLLLN